MFAAMKGSATVYRSICLVLLALLFAGIAQGGSRFVSNYPCKDAVRRCVSSGEREIDGLKVSLDCWEWSYIKTCKYPSKNNCSAYDHCYSNGDKECLLRDSLGYCVNRRKEISCKSWDVVNKENQTARIGFEEKEGKDGLICKAIPCIDGNCVDKSFMTNGEMMDSLSRLHATSKMKPDKNNNFNLFEGNNRHCSKKPLDYSSCCRISDKGWGKHLGHKCTPDEELLKDLRSQNLCVYVGKESKKNAIGMTSIIKHKYCCFGNLLDKVIQVEGRKQLGRDWGSPSSPDCRGLTLEEIQRIKWDQVDFSEFIEELKVKFAGELKMPKAGDLKMTVKGSMGSIRNYKDYDPSNKKYEHDKEHNMTGWRGDIETHDAIETRRAEEERKKREQEAERARQEQARQKRLAEEKKQREQQQKLLQFRRNMQAELNRKEQEYSRAKAASSAAHASWNNGGARRYPKGSAGFNNEWDKVRQARKNEWNANVTYSEAKTRYDRGY